MCYKLFYSIGYVAKHTGVAPHLIRTWEARYRAVTPQRSEKNRRLYCETDIRRLQTLNRLVGFGHSISQIAALSDDELARLKEGRKPGQSRLELKSSSGYTKASSYYRQALKAVSVLDGSELEGILNEAAISLTKPQLLFNVIFLLQTKMRRMLRKGRVRQVNFNVAHTVIRAFLWDLLRTAVIAETAPKLVIAAPKGQHNEIDALILALTGTESGWHSKCIGSNLSAEDIVKAVRYFEAPAVVLSVLQNEEGRKLDGELGDLRHKIPRRVKLIICGDRKFYAERKDIKDDIIMSQVNHFRQTLEALPAGYVV